MLKEIIIEIQKEIKLEKQSNKNINKDIKELNKKINIDINTDINKIDLNKSEEKQLSDIEIKHIFPEGTFAEDKSVKDIAEVVCSKSKNYNLASKRVVYFYNLNTNVKDRHKEVLDELKKICK